MIGIVIVAHGGLAKEYLAAVEHVVGKQSGILAVSIQDDHDRNTKQFEICDAADSVDVGHGVGGDRYVWRISTNLSLLACSPSDRKIIYGANMPMLIKLAKSRHLQVDQAVEQAKASGRKYIDSYDPKPK